jgi:hypothetical protein
MMKSILKWSELKKMGDNKFVNSMYVWIFVVPFIAKTFEYISTEKLDFIIFQQTVSISTSLPFSWIMFYFCALSLALGNLIYMIKCPKMIKEHPTYQSFVDEGKNLKQLKHYSKDISFDWETLSKKINSDITTLKNKNKTGMATNSESYPNLNKEDVVHYFSPIYEAAEIKYIFLRVSSFSLFIIGFGLFGWVVVQNTIFVISFASR